MQLKRVRDKKMSTKNFDTFQFFNPNKQGIGEKSTTFVQNNFTP